MISVIVPAFNEENAIVEVVEKIHQTLSQANIAPAEVIVVDDGSTDQTGAKAKSAGATVITHLNNLGYGKSLKDGINAARHDTIVITDSDGTYPIDRIPDLVREYQKGYDMVVGSRQGKHLNATWIKGILRRVLKWIVDFSTGRDIPDINSGLRVFSKKASQKYFSDLSNSFSFTTSITLVYSLTYKLTHYIPIEYDKRVGSTKVHLFRDILRTIQFITEVILFYNPFKVFVCFSFGLFCLSVAAFVAAGFSWCYPQIRILPHFFPVGLVFLILSVVIIGFGFISIQLKQILHASAGIREDQGSSR